MEFPSGVVAGGGGEGQVGQIHPAGSKKGGAISI